MSTEGFKRRLSAILSADVKEYSRLMRDDEDATIRALTTYRSAIAKLVQQYRGRVVDSPGDNVLAEFGSVVDAVNCAVEIQRDLAERNAELPYHRRMEFRIGINLGDVVEEGDRIYGDGINIAARVEGLAQGGGICISGTVYDSIEGKLGLEFEYLGEHEVKNIDKPIRVYRVLSFPGAAAHRVVQAKTVSERRWRKAALVVTAAFVLGAGVVLVWNFFLRPVPPPLEPASVERMAFPLPDKPSIAVLPFVNMSDDPKQEYFSDGITEDLITDLSKISGLFVIARNSTFAYKGKFVKIRQIAEELGVRYVLEGSVRKATDKIRINTQLIDATTGHHVWAERYDSNFDDVFALQDRITRKIITALAVRLTPREQEKAVHKETDNVAAYDAFLKGWEHLCRHTPDDLAKALFYFEKTIKLDPNYDPTYSALALTCKIGAEWAWNRQSLDIFWGTLAFVQMRKYLEMALKSPTAVAHQIASEMYLRHRNFEEAIAEAERAIALDPNSSASHSAMAYALIFSGRAEEAINFIKKARRLDPRSPGIYLMLLGVAHFCMGQLEEAINLIERGLKHDPAIHMYESFLASACAHLGRDQEARAAVNNYKKTWKTGLFVFTPNLRRVMHVWPFKDSKVADRFANGLLKAGLPGEPSGYYKLSKENRLTGEEIRALIFGRTLTGLSPVNGFPWHFDYAKDGKITSRGPGAVDTGTDSGTCWIEGDMLCSKWKWSYEGLKFCVSIFRNPEGTQEMKNEYLYVTDYEIFPFSLVD